MGWEFHGKRRWVELFSDMDLEIVLLEKALSVKAVEPIAWEVRETYE